jgi:hypothetical protein
MRWVIWRPRPRKGRNCSSEEGKSERDRKAKDNKAGKRGKHSKGKLRR